MKNQYTEANKKKVEEYVIEYLPQVKRIALKLAGRVSGTLDVDDLIQIGMIGLLDAISKYDSSKDNLFRTYAEFRIRGAMLDQLRSLDWIPRSVREMSTKLERAYTELRNEGVDHPTEEMLAKKLEIPEEELPEFLKKARPIPLVNFEDLGKFVGEDLDIMETISADDDRNPEEHLLFQTKRNTMIEAIDNLPENEKIVLSLYYKEDMNLKEIGQVLDLTESRVSQIRTKAIARIKSHIADV